MEWLVWLCISFNSVCTSMSKRQVTKNDYITIFLKETKNQLMDRLLFAQLDAIAPVMYHCTYINIASIDRKLIKCFVCVFSFFLLGLLHRAHDIKGQGHDRTTILRCRLTWSMVSTSRSFQRQKESLFNNSPITSRYIVVFHFFLFASFQFLCCVTTY